MRFNRTVLSLSILLGGLCAHGQIDPYHREMIQVGYSQPLQGHAPLSGYAFYHLNQPNFLDRTNLTLRLSIAPVYLDTELGIAEALGPNTHVGVGAAGGGWADSYSEIRRGTWVREESFTGHGGRGGISFYHLFNPDSDIPLYGIVRGETAFATFIRDQETAPTFRLPSDQTVFIGRTGVRWGGSEPLLLPALGMELSAWYEGHFPTDPQSYGFNGDRRIEDSSHLFWGRALLTYTIPSTKHRISVATTVGTSVQADRLSAYRLGGLLPLASEFPLGLPGYYFQEISARSYALFSGSYLLPLTRSKRLAAMATAAAAYSDYLRGLEQPGRWNSGVGGGLVYRSRSDAWQVLVSYGYGIDAIRHDGRGAHNIGVLVQIDLDRRRSIISEPGVSPQRSRGLQEFLRSLRFF